MWAAFEERACSGNQKNEWKWQNNEIRGQIMILYQYINSIFVLDLRLRLQ